MSDLTLDHRALEAWLPHRGLNMLPDQVVLAEDRRTSVSTTRVLPGDPRGREFYGRRGAGGQRWWTEPYLIELMALTGLPLIAEKLKAQGCEAVFSVISRVESDQPAPLYAPITGHARVMRERGGFTTFETRVEIEGRTVLSAEVMNGAAAPGEIAAFPCRPFREPPPRLDADLSCLDYKAKPLVFLDHLVQEDRAAGRLVGAFTYPADHPFVPGHFPSAPLMMGVSQWAAMADAAWLACRRFGLSGPVLAQGGLRRQDGTPVYDLRDLELTVEDGLPRMSGCKRMVFREPVRPGDGVLIEVAVAPRP